jgi:hypothetical protein
MKAHMRVPRICAWVLFAVVLCEFAFIAYSWFSYCSPIEAARFALSGQWLKEPFYRGSAGLALDQPTVGKFFLWTSVMSCLACTMVLLLHTVVDAARQVARRCVTICAALLVALVLIELLAPTFLLVQYVLSMGITIRRFLGLCLCCGFWVSLPSIVFWIRKVKSTEAKWIRSPLAWALACSLIAPTYYISGMLHPYTWRHWDAECTVFLLVWIGLVAPTPCIMWIRAWERRDRINHSGGEHRTTKSTLSPEAAPSPAPSER